ncbi:NIPSNAP family protein [Rhizobium tubonense]|uniref:NIPSNAP domain-containing protein n=1 Tax=Rhizobium tubonense TaxID=484088 RepID=A0A2W4D1B1_9HYPH|nr:NIPSNAP family protein [Rhizobium tubonense]PZM17211.1 hypothetical protein CPY51_03005 [Rhizobium tubonense]
MITWIRSAAIASGKLPDAFAFVKSAAKLIEEKHNIKITASRPLAGNPTRVFWYSTHDDLQAYEREHQKINTDPEFQKMLGGASDCFIAGTTHDEILQTI